MDKFKILRNKNYSLLLFGMTTSNFGTSISSVAIILFFLKNFSLEMSTSLIAGYWVTKLLAETFLTPYLSNLVDCCDRKKIIIFCDIFRGLLYIVFSYSILFINNNIFIYLFYFIIFALSNFFRTSIFSIVPSIVEEESLDSANSLTNSFMEFSWLIGGILGGVFYSLFDINTILFFDGITFLLSALSEFPLKIPYNKNKIIKESKLDKFLNLKMVKEIYNDKSLAFLISFEIIYGLLLSSVFRILMPYFANNIICIESSKFGFFDSIMTFGIVVGSFLYRKNLNHIYKIISINSLLLSISFIMFFYFTILIEKYSYNNYLNLFYISSFLLMLTGIFQSNINIPLVSYYQKIISKNKLGKFYGTRIVFIKLSMVLGITSFSYFIKTNIAIGYLLISIFFFCIFFSYNYMLKNIHIVKKNNKIS